MSLLADSQYQLSGLSMRTIQALIPVGAKPEIGLIPIERDGGIAIRFPIHLVIWFQSSKVQARIGARYLVIQPPDPMRRSLIEHVEKGRFADGDAGFYKFASPIEVPERPHVEAVRRPA